VQIHLCRIRSNIHSSQVRYTIYLFYAVARMMTTQSIGSSSYFVAAFDQVAIEYGVETLRKVELDRWKTKTKTWQVRHGVKEFCTPRI
jgi:hypothetical protein